MNVHGVPADEPVSNPIGSNAAEGDNEDSNELEFEANIPAESDDEDASNDEDEDLSDHEDKGKSTHSSNKSSKSSDNRSQFSSHDINFTSFFSEHLGEKKLYGKIIDLDIEHIARMCKSYNNEWSTENIGKIFIKLLQSCKTLDEFVARHKAYIHAEARKEGWTFNIRALDKESAKVMVFPSQQNTPSPTQDVKEIEGWNVFSFIPSHNKVEIIKTNSKQNIFIPSNEFELDTAIRAAYLDVKLKKPENNFLLGKLRALYQGVDRNRDSIREYFSQFQGEFGKWIVLRIYNVTAQYMIDCERDFHIEMDTLNFSGQVFSEINQKRVYIPRKRTFSNDKNKNTNYSNSNHGKSNNNNKRAKFNQDHLSTQEISLDRIFCITERSKPS